MPNKIKRVEDIYGNEYRLLERVITSGYYSATRKQVRNLFAEIRERRKRKDTYPLMIYVAFEGIMRMVNVLSATRIHIGCCVFEGSTVLAIRRWANQGAKDGTRRRNTSNARKDKNRRNKSHQK